MAVPAHEQHLAKTPLWSGASLLPELLHALPLAVVGLDRENRVTLWNDAAERLFGWSGRRMPGQAPANHSRR